MIVTIHTRPQAPLDIRHRSRGGPVTSFAQTLHAHLFGLPAEAAPLPTALDALLQATHHVTSPQQHTAILRQLADQLRNATEIIKGYQYLAQWDRLPADVAQQLRQARDQAQQMAATLDHVAPAFSSLSSAEAVSGPRPHLPQDHTAQAPATSPTPRPGPRR